jgi:Txe/YoeB family toxin of Txe-Axe toxin-antitoxin module
MYVKDEDTWEKDEENKKMHRVVKKVTDKNARLILKYKELHPDCMTYHSRYSDQYNKIIVESMGGSGDNMFEKEEKIIQRVSKNVTVDKEAV